MSGKVLVVLDREEAAHIWERSVHGGLEVEEATSDALRAALDTPWEETGVVRTESPGCS